MRDAYMPPELEAETNKESSGNVAQPLTPEDAAKILATAKAVRAERDEIEKRHKQAEAKLKELEGIDPQKFKELQAQIKGYEEKQLEEKQQYGQLKEVWQQERQAKDKRIQELESKLQDTSIIHSLEKAFYASGGKADSSKDGKTYFDLIAPIARQYIAVDDDGKLVVIDPRDRIRKTTDKGNFYTIEELMNDLRSDGPTATLFNPVTNPAGGGSQRSINPSRGGMTHEQIMNLPISRAEKLAKIRELKV
jgi:molecular chaperone GrpE (heat shock protein)